MYIPLDYTFKFRLLRSTNIIPVENSTEVLSFAIILYYVLDMYIEGERERGGGQERIVESSWEMKTVGEIKALHFRIFLQNSPASSARPCNKSSMKMKTLS
jgi:hypothetical protein